MAWARARIDPSFEVATGYVGGKLECLSQPWTATRGRDGCYYTRPTRSLGEE